MNKKFMVGCFGIFIVIIVFVAIFGFSYYVKTRNNMVRLEENVSEKWSQVENVYQRRMDLIPNLVETVKGYAEHEKETFSAVTEARAKAGGTFQVSGDMLNDPQAFARFQQAQNSLGGALSRLMVVMEKYPELKANQNFLSLQDQLEGTENRITVERQRFNEAAKEFNIYIKLFPKSVVANFAGFTEKPYFKAAEGANQAPEVKF